MTCCCGFHPEFYYVLVHKIPRVKPTPESIGAYGFNKSVELTYVKYRVKWPKQ